MKKCPHCAEEIQDAAIKCKHCGEALGQAATSAGGGQDQVSPLRLLGLLMFIGGLAALAYYFNMDVSVAVPTTDIPGFGSVGGGRVNNIGLMQDRQNGLMLGGAAAALGFIAVIAGQFTSPKR